MTGEFEVRCTETARDDLLRWFDFLLDRARTVEDFDAAQDAIDAIDAIKSEVEGQLGRSPFTYRKVGHSPFRRELVIPFRGSGYVVPYEIEGRSTVNIVAVRHPLEDDYH